jgi:hypothetical protein
MNQSPLLEIATLLNSEGTNYTVFLRAFPCTCDAQASTEALVLSALGDEAVVERSRSVTIEEAVAAISEGLSYRGDEAAGPGVRVLKSNQFAALLNEILMELRSLAQRGALVEEVHLQEGHPAYPVFWEFGFLVRDSKEPFLLIGSSSD